MKVSWLTSASCALSCTTRDIYLHSVQICTWMNASNLVFCPPGLESNLPYLSYNLHSLTFKVVYRSEVCGL